LSQFVKNAFLAHSLKLGEDYVVRSRHYGVLSLEVRLKSRINKEHGLLQFLELRHGCSLSSYRVRHHEGTISDLLESYGGVRMVLRENHFRTRFHLQNVKMNIIALRSPQRPFFTSHSEHNFPFYVSNTVEKLSDHLVVVVCPTIDTLKSTVALLSAIDSVVVSISESPLGVTQEIKKNLDGKTIVVCTTTAYFESWNHIPQPAAHVKLIVGTHSEESASRKKAHELANLSEIEDIFVSKSSQNYQKSESQSSSIMDWMKSKFNGDKVDDPESLIGEYSKSLNINKLLRAKRMLWRQLQSIESSARVVHSSRQSIRTLNSVDSPIDIASDGFIHDCQILIEQAMHGLKGIDDRLSHHISIQGHSEAKIDETELTRIARNNQVDERILATFVKRILSNKTPVT
ncbi:hypothetical protein PFISCL1PPCAC_24025, partial [Pristionchus fissidentatus]